MHEVMVLNNSYLPVAKTNWERGIVLIILDKAFSIKDTAIEIRSENLIMKIPKTIVLKNISYVRRHFAAYCKKAVFKRDNYTCQMCGETDRTQLTLEHIIPKSRWAKVSAERELIYQLNSFENTCSLCRFCNSRVKGDRLPEEIGWNFTAKAPLVDFDINWDEIFN